MRLAEPPRIKGFPCVLKGEMQGPLWSPRPRRSIPKPGLARIRPSLGGGRWGSPPRLGRKRSRGRTLEFRDSYPFRHNFSLTPTHLTRNQKIMMKCACNHGFLRAFSTRARKRASHQHQTQYEKRNLPQRFRGIPPPQTSTSNAEALCVMRRTKSPHL